MRKGIGLVVLSLFLSGVVLAGDSWTPGGQTPPPPIPSINNPQPVDFFSQLRSIYQFLFSIF